MSDDLRTRIAAVIYADVIPTPPESVVEQAADAVIRELELTKQYLVDGIISDGEPRPWELPCETRYATEWERFDD